MRYRRLPAALATNRRIRSIIGVVPAEKLGDVVEKHGAGAFGSVFFGLALGLSPVVGGFFGLPIDIRHITLSTASVVLAALSLGAQTVHSGALGWAIAGLTGIALMNFTVSFSLALAVALRARDVDARVFRLLVATVLGRLVRRPLDFILPLRAKTAAETTTTTT